MSASLSGGGGGGFRPTPFFFGRVLAKPLNNASSTVLCTMAVIAHQLLDTRYRMAIRESGNTISSGFTRTSPSLTQGQ